MATTIESTKLDFQQIKDALKTYFVESGEFNDYDFEGAALSNLLDVLAYNTHYNGLIANFALNESYLSTAQLRNSVVSLAESIGYIPNSMKSAEAVVTLTINLAGVPNLEETYSLQPGELVLQGSKDGIDYTFTNRETLVATAGGTGIYTFLPQASEGSTETTTLNPIRVFEGIEKTQQFLVGSGTDVVYVIPDESIDIETAIVKVFTNQAGANLGGDQGAFNTYTALEKATTIDEASNLYVLRESPNQFFELTFGNGTSLGKAPVAGNVIDVNYLRTTGAIANGITTLKVSSTITLGTYTVDPANIALAVTSKSSGGGDKETVESIRKNAPFQYASQNRMVTALDYSALILKNYSSFIKDIKSWGGEDDPYPQYGAVFTSIVFKDGLSNATITEVRKGIRELADSFSVVSFDLVFTDPVETYISTETFFQFNPTLTGQSQSNVIAAVEKSIRDYFNASTGKFDQNFRRSRMLDAVDETETSVLSSRSNVKLHRRLLPTLSIPDNYTIKFPASLRAASSSDEPTITSSLFVFKNQLCFIRNKLNDRTLISPVGSTPLLYSTSPSSKLEVVSLGGAILQDNVGYYTASTGEVYLQNLTVQSVSGSVKYIKLFAVPANQSVINSELNNIIKWDEGESTAIPIIVDERV
jgi:hypothetical protein